MNELTFPPHAVWIGSEHPFDLHEVYLDLRRTFELPASPQSAHLFITADSRYRLWVNGRFVARGPARCYPHAQSVDQINVAPYLRAGPNTLAVQVYQPGYSHFAYVHRAAAGLLAHLVCDGQSRLTTDARWKSRRNPSFADLVPRVSIYGSGIEERNLHLEDDWIAVDYDDSHWSAARVVAPVYGYPWTDLQLRDLPLVQERPFAAHLVETRRGTLPAWPADAHLALRAGWFSASSASITQDADGWYQPALAADEAAYWLFDLGRGYACQGWVEIEAAGGEEVLAISYTEKMAGHDLYLSDPATYCRVRMTDRFHLRPGAQIAEPFALRGGRFIVFQLCGPTGPHLRLRLHIRVAEYPLEVSQPLETSDPVLAGIIQLCEETFRACLLDGFIDNPWREQAQWVGDALPQSLIMFAMTEDTHPLRRIIELAAQGAYPDGVLPGVGAGEVHAYTVVDYNFMWIHLLRLYNEWREDAPFLTQMWPTLVALLERFHQDLNPDGLLISQTGRRLFLDWSPQSRREPSAVYNLHYLLGLQHAIALAQQQRAVEEAGLWQARATKLQAAIRAAFWQAGRWYDDLERTTFSQLAASLAVLTDTARPAEQAEVLQAIAARSLDLNDDFDPDTMVLASPFMHHYIFEALRKGGQDEAVLEIIRQRWGRWVEAGYPTAWENWNVDFPDGSQCHAFSAHPRYHLAAIARKRGTL